MVTIKRRINIFILIAFTLQSILETLIPSLHAKEEQTIKIANTKTSQNHQNKTPKKNQKARSDIALTWDKLGKLAQIITKTRKIVSFFDPNKISHFLEYKFIPQPLRDGYEFLELIAPGAVTAGLNYGLKTLITAPLDGYLQKTFPLEQKAIQTGSYYAVQIFRQFIKIYDPTSEESMAERFVCNHYGPKDSDAKETALKRVRMATIAFDGLGVIAAIYTLQQLELAWAAGKQNKPIHYFGEIVPALKNLTVTYETFMKKYHHDSRATKLISEFSAQALPVLSALLLGGIKELPFINIGGALDALIFKLRTYNKKPKNQPQKTKKNTVFHSLFN